MASNTTHDQPDVDDDDDLGVRMMRAIIRGVLASVPVALIVITTFVYIATDKDLVDSFATATVSSLLLGVFAGGFVGVVRSMH